MTLFLNVKLSQIPHGKSNRSLWLYMLHLCQWFYIWLHCYTECTVFLCGWWQWWGSRVEMGFSCPCSSLTLAQQMGKKLHWGSRGQSVYLPHGRIFIIAPKWAIFLMTCSKKMMPQSREQFPLRWCYKLCVFHASRVLSSQFSMLDHTEVS